MTTEDTKRAIVTHLPDGEHYVVEYVAEDDDERTARTVRAVGPLSAHDFLAPGADTLEVSAAQFDHLAQTAWEWDSDDLAEWLDAEERAGRVSYPIGVR